MQKGDYYLHPAINSSALFAALFNKMVDWVFVYDFKHLQIVAANTSLQSYFSDDADLPELQEKDVLQSIIHPEDWKAMMEAFQQLAIQPDTHLTEFFFRSRVPQNGFSHAGITDANTQKNKAEFFKVLLSRYHQPGDDTLYILGIVQDHTELNKRASQRDYYKNKLQDLSLIASDEMRHEYAKVQSVINLIDNRYITDVERKDLIDEAKKSAQVINSAIFKLSHQLSFNPAGNEDALSKHDRKQYSKIIFIDDDVLTNVLNKKIVQAILPDMPVEVFVDIDEALKHLKQRPDETGQLIFLDINFPGRGGWEFLAEYSRFSADANVVVLSSSIDNRDREKAGGYKAVIDYITKPLSFEFIKTFFEQL